MTEELYKRYRPESFKQVIGQDDALASLIDMGKRNVIPHCILFTGPSGVGKTTIARILRHKLKCGDADYREINASDQRGIDTVRDIRSVMSLAPIAGKTRVWVCDEVHQLTSDAQNAFLKILEDTPSHVYFFLSTTDPQKLKKTIVTRAHEVKLKALGAKDLKVVVEGVLAEEMGGVEDENGNNVRLPDEVMEKLVDVADGSARKALVLLHSIIGLEGEQEQLDAIEKGDHKRQAIELARLLMRGGSWNEVAKVLKSVDGEPEQLRWMVLGYCKSVLLGGGKMVSRAAAVIDRFQDHFYDSKHAGLALACWDVTKGE